MINPLEVLEDMALHATDERTKVSAAKALADYTHAKMPPSNKGQEGQQVNIVMLIGEKNTKVPTMVD